MATCGNCSIRPAVCMYSHPVILKSTSNSWLIPSFRDGVFRRRSFGTMQFSRLRWIFSKSFIGSIFKSSFGRQLQLLFLSGKHFPGDTKSNSDGGLILFPFSQVGFSLNSSNNLSTSQVQETGRHFGEMRLEFPMMSLTCSKRYEHSACAQMGILRHRCYFDVMSMRKTCLSRTSQTGLDCLKAEISNSGSLSKNRLRCADAAKSRKRFL